MASNGLRRPWAVDEMEFSPALQQGVLIQRYKRFLADIETADGRRITIHCPNTGSMLNCQDPGSRIWYSTSSSAGRKYPHTWELVETGGGDLVGINTGRANPLVEEALGAGILAELQGYTTVRREVRFGQERSRIDFLLSNGEDSGESACYVEVKNVSLGAGSGIGFFPDAVTTRGQKHLRELMQVAAQGQRAVLLFCVQHSGVQLVRPADHIDPDYSNLLRAAAAAGVELLAYGARLSPQHIELAYRVPVQC